MNRASHAIFTAILTSCAVFTQGAVHAWAGGPATGPVIGPATGPATVPGDWFAVADATTRPGSAASAFAALYPRLAAADPATRAATPRIVFNGMGQKMSPTLRLPRMTVTGNLFTDISDRAHAVTHPGDPWLLVPDERKVRMAAIECARLNAAFCFDIEALPLDVRDASAADVERSVRTLAQMAGWARAQDPSLRVFLYGCMPTFSPNMGSERRTLATTLPSGPAYGWWQAKRPQIEREYARWQSANAMLRAGPGRAVSLAEQFDGVCPSLYNSYRADDPDPIEAVRTYALQHLDEARLYGRPVYPFVWPHWFNRHEFVDLRVWVELLRVIMVHADGAIIWEDFKNPWNTPMAVRVRVASILAERRGEMTDREVYDALRKDGFAPDTEIADLLQAPLAGPATDATPPTPTMSAPATQQTK